MIRRTHRLPNPTAITTTAEAEKVYFAHDDRCARIVRALSRTDDPGRRAGLCRELVALLEDQAVIYRLVEHDPAIAVEVQSEHNDEIRILRAVADAETARASRRRRAPARWPDLERHGGRLLDLIALPRPRHPIEHAALYRELAHVLIRHRSVAGAAEVLATLARTWDAQAGNRRCGR